MPGDLSRWCQWRSAITIACICMAVCLNVSRAGAIVPNPVKASLVSSVDSITPGTPFTVGILFQIERGWHTYWQFAGDAGLPPKIKWQLPDGWTVKNLQWPIPRKFIESGPLTTYGYVDSVMLMVDLVPPAELVGGEQVDLGAHVSWLVCHSECITGEATIDLSLPTGSKVPKAASSPLLKQRFEHWRLLLPSSEDGSGIVANAQAKQDTNTAKSAQVTLSIQLPDRVKQRVLDWFPLPSPDMSVSEMVQHQDSAGTRITFQLKSYKGTISSGAELRSLLIYRDSAGRKRGVQLSTPISVS